MADKDGDSAVIPIGTGRRASRKRAQVPMPAPAGPFFSPSLLPALERLTALLSRYARPDDTCAGDAFPRMHPGDRQEAEQLAELLEPVLAPRLTARGA